MHSAVVSLHLFTSISIFLFHSLWRRIFMRKASFPYLPFSMSIPFPHIDYHFVFKPLSSIHHLAKTSTRHPVCDPSTPIPPYPETISSPFTPHPSLTHEHLTSECTFPSSCSCCGFVCSEGGSQTASAHAHRSGRIPSHTEEGREVKAGRGRSTGGHKTAGEMTPSVSGWDQITIAEGSGDHADIMLT